MACVALAPALSRADGRVVVRNDPAASSQDAAYQKPTNLKVLPQDISAAELKRSMERYADALGVSCGFCHTQNPETRQLDYASDDNPAKLTARVMISMLDDINLKFLSQLDDPRYAVHVTCGNCHQGQQDPPPFEPKPATARSER